MSADGIATVSGGGASLSSQVGAAVGAATVAAVRTALSSQVGAASGVSTTAFVAVPRGPGATTGAATVAGTASSTSAQVGAASGTSNADAYTAASIDVVPSVDRGIVVQQTGPGSTRIIVPDTYRNPFNIGVGCEADGPVTYTVEHTFEDVFDPAFSASSAVWFANSGLSGKTASANGNYAYPVNGIRLTVSAGAGTVRAYIVQAGTR